MNIDAAVEQELFCLLTVEEKREYALRYLESQRLSVEYRRMDKAAMFKEQAQGRLPAIQSVEPED